jgi:two-component system, OmpR family, sensor kinase
MSLRGRLLVSFSYLLLLAVAALAVPLALNIERRARTELESRLAASAQVIASSVAEFTDPGQPLAPLRKVVAEYANELEGDVVVTDERGRVLADSAGTSQGTEIGNRPEIQAALEGGRVRESDPTGSALFVAVPVVSAGEAVGAVRVAGDLSELNSNVLRSRLVLVAVGGFVVVGGMAVAWALASSLARPLRNLSSTARRLGSGDLNARADVSGPRDVAEVAGAMNAMAADLASGVEAQRDFVANASHQLRTPLTGLRIRLEGIASGEGPDAKSAAAAIAEVDRLGGLVDDLLLLARSATTESTGQSVDLAASVKDAVQRWSPRARERDQVMGEVASTRVDICADPDDVSGVLDNLIENAIAYCPAGTRIQVEAAGMNGEGRLIVRDNGPGIPSEDEGRVFERFYRGRTGRQSGPGTGLGLAIVREVAERWGGRAEVDSSSKGTHVVVSWPVSRTER